MRSHDLAAANAWLLVELPTLLVAVMTAVLTPLALAAAGVPRWLRIAAWPAGALAAIGFVAIAVPGTPAVLITLPYAIVALAAGVVGVGRLVARHGPASRIALAAGLVFLPAATLWLLAYRAGYALLGYPPFWVILTAAHFHVAGVYLLTIAGRVAHDRGRFAAAIAIACVVAVPLTAAGIYGPRWLELGAAITMAVSGFGVGVLLVGSPRSASRRTLRRLAGAILLLTMPLAGAFALRDHGTSFTILGLDPLASMLIAHGTLNVLGFALAALGALAPGPLPPALLDAPPFSDIAGGVTIGASFLARRGLERATDHVGSAPCGLVDRLEDLTHADLDAGKVALAIRTFYERSGEHAMIVAPTWRFGFRIGARIWAWFARRIGQLQLPVRAEDGREGITSRIVAVDASADGRAAPRSWIRTFPDGRAMYVAIYSTHLRDDRAYMNIAFPLPGGHLTSILRMDHLARSSGGVSVSTRFGGDCGVWLVVRAFGRTLPIQTPFSETIDVWTTDDAGAPAALRAFGADYTTIARHTLWLFGIHYLTLNYAMRLRST